MWEIEFIPDENLLFYRIHENWIEDGEVNPGVFRERGEGENKGMSTDWGKYSSPADCKSRSPNPDKNGIVHFVTKDLRSLELKVVHSPIVVDTPIKNKPWITSNRAHTNVTGHVENVKVRLKLLDLFKWEINPTIPTKF